MPRATYVTRNAEVGRVVNQLVFLCLRNVYGLLLLYFVAALDRDRRSFVESGYQAYWKMWQKQRG